MKKTKTLSVASMMASLCVVILAMGSLVESLDVSLAILSGLVVMVVSTEYADKVGFLVFAVASIISLFFPVKSAGILFLAFFGWYPMVQKRLQMLKPFLCITLKFFMFNVILILLLVLSAYVTGTVDAKGIYLATLILANVCFYLYDILLDRFLIWYIMKLRKHLRF